MKICIVCGARPNFIKVAPLLRVLKARQRDFSLIYTGREDDPTLESSLFDDLQIPRPDVYLGVDSQSLNEITGRVMGEFDQYLDSYAADVVIVVDDLASTMAAAIVTKKRGIRLAHLVAGTRSFDISMPKEVNRLVIDGLSDLLFTAGISSSSHTTNEGVAQSKKRVWGPALPQPGPCSGQSVASLRGTCHFPQGIFFFRVSDGPFLEGNFCVSAGCPQTRLSPGRRP